MLVWVGLSILLLGFEVNTETANCSVTCLEDSNNTTEPCNITSGECLYGCVQGYGGPNCSRECPVNCAIPSQNETEICDFESGNCTFGCIPGYVGSTCSCFENCVNETCDTANGVCSLGCTKGFAGPTCVCPSNCGSTQELATDTCNITSRECLFGCREGFTGLNCSTACPANCALPLENNTKTCEDNSKECLYGCNPGFASPTCSYNCSETCRLPASNEAYTCNATTGECLLGCQYGYSGFNCSFQCPENCGISIDLYTETCDETSGECLHGCLQGYGGPDCSFSCSANCTQPLTNDTETCNATTGACLFGCLPGLAGPHCFFECSANCSFSHEYNVDTCNYTSGECLHGCKPGLAGPECSYICPFNCLLPEENGTETCNYTTGECLHGCKPGFAGPECSFICPSNCLYKEETGTETCNYTTGECLHGCQEGLAGPNCTVNCPRNCSSSNISGTEICNATSKECLFGCKDGSYGDRCEIQCSNIIDNCTRCSSVNGSAVCDACTTNYHRHNGKCIKCGYCASNTSDPLHACRESDGYCNYGCDSGRYGFKCGIRCSSTCNNICHRNTGVCLTGCKNPSYCGPKCEDTCNVECASQRCEQSCVCSDGCIANRWGEQCEKFCAETCRKPSNRSGYNCDRSNGSCLHGCENDNYFGSQCGNLCSSACVGSVCEQTSGKCPNGCNSTKVYGIGCDKACNKNCVDGTCLRSDGYCDRGCVKGSYGDRCHMNCSKNCHDGSCNRTNGYCDFGCSNGFHGDLCDQECNQECWNRRCDRNSGSCTDAPPKFDTNWIYVAFASGAIVLLGVMITIVLVTKKRKKIARRRRAARLSQIPDEKFLEEAQMRHKRKGEGAGARMTALFIDNPLARIMKYKSQGGGHITKIALDDLLRKVLKMDENDYSREFDEFDVGLKRPHEVSRRTDNLERNFFNEIYPYDENRVVLTHCLEDVPRKSISKHWGFPVQFRLTSHGHEYELMSAVKKNDRSNGNVNVDLDIKDVTDVAKEKHGMPISDDNVTVEVGRDNQASSSSNNVDNTLSSDYAKVNLGETFKLPTEEEEDASTDNALIPIKITSDTEPNNDQSCEYARVNKDTSAKNLSVQEIKNVQEVDDNSYAVVNKPPKPNEMEDTGASNKRNIDNDGKVFFQRDYINASFIKGYTQNEKYIAAQAPAKLTADDFWLMVWEQKSLFIVMLTVIPEDGYSRCEKYWPDKGKQDKFCDITVECEEVTVYANYTIRTFKLILKNGIERDVIHMQFTSWPDEGCPVSAIEFIQFHQKYRSMTKGRHSGGPTVVHCTAGIGRTGVFIALDFLVEEGLDSLNVDVFKCVTALREQRVDMVHTVEQYEFLYKAIAQTFALGCQPILKVKLADKLEELKKFDHNSGKTKLEVLYDNLKASLALDTVELATIDVVQERKKKDRPKSDVPEVLFRAGLPHNVYINAVIFESSKKREAMVATQMPTSDTVQDFCQLLIYHKCTTIIMLNQMDPNDKTNAMYWPTEKTPFVSGQTIISQLHLEKQPDYNIRQLRVQSPELSGETLAVTMVQYKGWKIVKNVPNAKNLLKLLLLCQRYIKDAPDKTLLVHCMNGAEQSGLFCALVNLFEAVDLENEISVTSVVRKILARRPNAIPTVDQFEACFTTTCEYIKKQETA